MIDNTQGLLLPLLVGQATTKSSQNVHFAHSTFQRWRGSAQSAAQGLTDGERAQRESCRKWLEAF